MKTKDLLITGLIFGLLINVASNVHKDHKIYKLQNEVLDTKKEYIKLYQEDKEYIQVLEQSRDSLNNYIDDLEYQIKDIQSKDKLLKDLVRNR